MSYQHAVVWIDHLHANVIDFSLDDKHVATIEKVGGSRQVHRKSGIPGPGKAPDDPHFFDAVVESLGNAGEVLVVGPGNAKLAFQHHLAAKHPNVAKRVVGLETVDHPSTGELLAYARKYFKRIDALRGEG